MDFAYTFPVRRIKGASRALAVSAVLAVDCEVSVICQSNTDTRMSSYSYTSPEEPMQMRSARRSPFCIVRSSSAYLSPHDDISSHSPRRQM